VDRFLRQKYLYWLESLGILGCVLEGITAMLKLEGLLYVSIYSNSESILVLTRYFIEKRRVIGSARPSLRRVLIYLILQKCDRK
jgi:hypothetical protein